MAKSRKKTQTPVQKEYYKQRKRIQNFISRAKKRGYVFEENILPNVPKKITQASVNRLKNLTAKELYKKGWYVQPTTGEAVEGLRGRFYERQKAAEKAKQTRKERIIARFIEQQADLDALNQTHDDWFDDDISEVDYNYTKPVVDKWAEIGRRIKEEFPSQILVVPEKGGKGKGFYADTFTIANSLYELWRDTDDRVGDREALNRYVDEHEDEFADAMDSIAIYTAGDGSVVITHDMVFTNSISKLATFLNYGQMLTPDQSEGIGWMGDYYGNVYQ